MELILDGKEWEADYFISSDDDLKQMRDPLRIEFLGMQGAVTSNFVDLSGHGGVLPAKYRARIPGCDRTVLEDAGEIPDPMYARNLERSRWAEGYSWAFRRHFTLPEAMRNARRIRLEFAGLDYQCQVWLNGVRLGYHCDAFMAAEFDITRTVRRDGDNLLAVIFEPIYPAAPFHSHSKPAEFAYYHRMQMSYGWDWSRLLLASGIFDTVRIHAGYDGYIRDVFFRGSSDRAVVELELDCEEAMEHAPLELRLTPWNFSGESGVYRREFALEHGRNRCRMEIELLHAHQWYPNGAGKPDLYELEVRFAGDVRTLPVGFRTLEMRRNPGSPADANALTYVINGEAVFVRGLNWVPADLRLSEVQEEEYERLIRLAAEAGFNFIRIWGGGTVEKEAFYRCCDRYGIMVHQEFMHSCSEYPQDGKYLAQKRREGIAILKKVRSHIAIVMICGGNEMQYYGEDSDSPLLRQYGELAAEYTPHLPYHVSSPDRSRPGERDHGPWHFHHHAFYNNHFRQFASEIGCNGALEEESVRRFIPDEAPFPDGPECRYHFMLLDQYKGLQHQWKFFAPESRGEYCQSSMLAQADALSYLMAHYRRCFPESSGCVLWQYDESWPTFAYSIVDFYHLPKIAHYFVGRVNRPSIVSLEDDSWCIENGAYSGKAFVTCDRPGRRAGRIVAVSAAGRVCYEFLFEGQYAAGTTAVAEVGFPVEPDDEVVFVRLELHDAAGKMRFCDTRHYGVPDFKRLFKLPGGEIEPLGCRRFDDGMEIALRNTGSTVAAGVRLKFPEMLADDVYFEDNYLALLPGETRHVTVKFAPNRTVTNLLEIIGWNVKKTKFALGGSIMASKEKQQGKDRKDEELSTQKVYAH